MHIWKRHFIGIKIGLKVFLLQAYTAYNVVTNNCEHFAHWCRHGWSISCQVIHHLTFSSGCGRLHMFFFLVLKSGGEIENHMKN